MSDTISVLPGILQKKKIRSISCGLNTTLFLTYGGMVYTNTDSNKENQKLIIDLLEYNIEQTYAGSQHFFCIGQKRNKSEEGLIIFSWGNNEYSQCGIDENCKYIQSPKIIFKNVFIKQISLGKNHSMILTNIGEVVIFGDNRFNQCSLENKAIIKVSENDNILPINEINYYITSIDYLDKNNEKIEKIEAKNDSSMMLTDKKSFIFRGKIFGKEKVFKLLNNIDTTSENEADITDNNLLYSFGGDNYFLLSSNNDINNNDNNKSLYPYIEVKNNNINNNSISIFF
jgi:alpha-tubulin suppressor-like RCC1 family protein